MIISQLNKTKLPAVVLIITLVLMKAMGVSMRDVIIFPLGSLSHGIHFRQQILNLTVERLLTVHLIIIYISSFLYVK